MVGPSASNDLAFTQSMVDSLDRLGQDYNITVDITDGTFVIEDAAVAIRGYAEDGFDIVLAHGGAIFGYPEVHLGFVPALVMAPLRRKVGEAAALELVMRGHRIGAAEAVALGLATRVLPGDDFETAADEYLRELAGRPTTAIALAKRLFHGLDGLSYEEAIARGAEINALARLTEDCRDGVRRFMHRKDS